MPHQKLSLENSTTTIDGNLDSISLPISRGVLLYHAIPVAWGIGGIPLWLLGTSEIGDTPKTETKKNDRMPRSDAYLWNHRVLIFAPGRYIDRTDPSLRGVAMHRAYISLARSLPKCKSVSVCSSPYISMRGKNLENYGFVSRALPRGQWARWIDGLWARSGSLSLSFSLLITLGMWFACSFFNSSNTMLI